MLNGFEAQGVTRDGRKFWMALTARLTRDPEHGDYIDGSLVDISERMQREQADKQREIAERLRGLEGVENAEPNLIATIGTESN